MIEVYKNIHAIYDNKSSAVAEIGDHGHNRHWPKIEEGAVPFYGRGSWVPI